MAITKQQKDFIRSEYAKVGETHKYYVDTVGAMVDFGDFTWLPDKERIETSFYFAERGYDYDEVSATCEALSRSERYFVAENVRRSAAFGRIMGTFGRGHSTWSHVPNRYYFSYDWHDSDGSKGLRFADICAVNRYNEHTTRFARWLTEEEVREYRRANVAILRDFVRRLRTYLKRYGLSKCRFTTYWADR